MQYTYTWVHCPSDRQPDLAQTTNWESQAQQIPVLIEHHAAFPSGEISVPASVCWWHQSWTPNPLPVLWCDLWRPRRGSRSRARPELHSCKLQIPHQTRLENDLSPVLEEVHLSVPTRHRGSERIADYASKPGLSARGRPHRWARVLWVASLLFE